MSLILTIVVTSCDGLNNISKTPPSVSVDSSGNVFLAGESDSTNDNIIYLDPPDNMIGIEGKGSTTGEIFVSKIVNEAQSAKMIGVVKEILNNNQVCVQFNGEITFDDEFGLSVSISGNTVIIGAYSDDDKGINSGSAYIFTNNGGTWIQTQKLTADDGESGNFFGLSVAISGNIAIVGANLDDDSGFFSGSAYIFTNNGGTWSQTQKTNSI